MKKQKEMVDMTNSVQRRKMIEYNDMRVKEKTKINVECLTFSFDD
jgi:hypothetical protein